MPAPTHDQILREPVVAANLKLEVAWGGSMSQWRDTTGAQVLQIINTPSADTGYPVSKIIDGQEQNYDPMTDTDTNYWRSGSGGSNDVIFDFGMVRGFNQIVVYQHADLPSLTGMEFYGSNDNVTYTLLWSGSTLGSKAVKDFSTTQSYRYVKFHPTAYGSDNTLRIAEIMFLNWIDSTDRLKYDGVDGDSQPLLQLTVKGEQGQNAIPTASELQVTLDNSDNDLSPWNTSSPYYYLEGPDGVGSGIRPQSRIRLSITAQSDLGSFTTQTFYGIVANDNNPGGSDGISFDDQSRTVMLVCKSILSRLDIEINTPVYEGASLRYVIRDVCQRCGINLADVSVPNITQGVPFLAFPQQTGTSVLGQCLQALPFLRVYETYGAAGWLLNVVNKGRTRTDIDVSRFWPAPATGLPVVLNKSPKGAVIFNGNKMFIFDWAGVTNSTPNASNVWVWDMTQPTGLGFKLFGSDTKFTNAVAFWTFGTDIYFIDYDAKVFKFDGTLSTLGTITSIGTAAASLSMMGAAVFNNFLYMFVRSTGVAGNATDLWVWDMTQAFSTRVHVGTLPYTLQRPGRNATPITVAPSGQGALQNYLVWKVDSNNVAIWKHAGTPYSTAFAANTVEVAYFSSTVIGGENYINNCLALGGNTISPNLMSIFVAIQKGSGLYRQEIWTLDIDAAYASPSINATKQGVVADDTSAVAVQPGTNIEVQISFYSMMDSYGMCMNVSYVYFMDTEMNMWVWDTNKDFSHLFQLSSNSSNRNSYPPYPAITQSLIFQYLATVPGIDHGSVARHIGGNSSPNNLDFTARIWFAKNDPTLIYGTYAGFNVQNGSIPFGTPSISFDIADGFTENLQINIGNPIGNRVVLQPSPYGLQSYTNLWTEPATGMRFPSNMKTTLPFQLNGTSSRYGTIAAWNRIFTCAQFTTKIQDNPSITTSVSIGGHNYPLTFFAYSDIGYLTIDCTGLPGVMITGGAVSGQPIAQPYTQSGYVDQADQISQSIYQKKILLSVNTPLIWDTSWWQDLLLNGKYAKPFIQGDEMPWYPILSIVAVLSVEDSVLGMPPTVFEVTEFNVDGFKTNFKGKVVFQTFDI